MIHTYKITGMTCDHCVKAVTDALQSIESIQSVEVTLDPPQATISMHEHVDVANMNAALAKVGCRVVGG